MNWIKNILPYIVIAVLFVLLILQNNDTSDFKNQLQKLHQQNDSLTSDIVKTKNEITKLDSISKIYKLKVEQDQNELSALKIKADKFKNKYNEEHNRIDALSNKSVVDEFTNAFE